MILLMSFIFISLLIVLFLTVLKFFISDSLYSSREESTSYECGFEHFSLSRIPVSIRYFMLTVVFLIFDLEIMLLVFVPSDFMSGVNFYFLVSVGFIFVFILFLGLLFEWFDGSLDWIM